ncbi:hypothetical protein GGR58DRAFT_480871, partial [Xylaria digitata]
MGCRGVTSSRRLLFTCAILSTTLHAFRVDKEPPASLPFVSRCRVTNSSIDQRRLDLPPTLSYQISNHRLSTQKKKKKGMTLARTMLGS